MKKEKSKTLTFFYNIHILLKIGSSTISFEKRQPKNKPVKDDSFIAYFIEKCYFQTNV